MRCTERGRGKRSRRQSSAPAFVVSPTTPRGPRAAGAVSAVLTASLAAAVGKPEEGGQNECEGGGIGGPVGKMALASVASGRGVVLVSAIACHAAGAGGATGGT